jgi:hypothetical protein
LRLRKNITDLKAASIVKESSLSSLIRGEGDDKRKSVLAKLNALNILDETTPNKKAPK